jgi:hypothetical protein
MQICKSVAGSVMNSGSREQHVAAARAFWRGRRRSTGTVRAEGRQPRAYFCSFFARAKRDYALLLPNSSLCLLLPPAHINPFCLVRRARSIIGLEIFQTIHPRQQHTHFIMRC